MRALLCLPLLLVSAALADEVADRAAIDHLIDRLNQLSPPLKGAPAVAPADTPAAIAESPLAEGEIARLLRFKLTVEMQPGTPAVVISHEPWGEATFGGISSTASLVLARVVIASVRFVGPEMALVDAAWQRDDRKPLDKPLLFVMKKVEGQWKIASVRELAPSAPKPSR